MKRNRLVLLLSGVVMLAGCNMALETPDATTTLTPTVTATASATATLTPSPTVTKTSTLTATPTLTPSPTITATPSNTPYPTATPLAPVTFANDQWTPIEVAQAIRSGMSNPWFAIVSINEDTADRPEAEQTPVPAGAGVETLYLIDPSNGQNVEIVDVPASTADRIYWAPDGRKVAYFMEPSLNSDGTRSGGLYLLNLDLGLSFRLFDIASLSPRGIPQHYPVWSPDSSQLAVALPTAYDVDIFLVSANGSVFQNATAHGAYDLWPAWSPDGQYLAFVSDRNTCPTWTPDQPGSCAAPDVQPPSGGNLFVMNIETGSVQQVTDLFVDGPAIWIGNAQLAFTTGLSDPMARESRIWLANFQSGTLVQISDADGSFNLGVAWAPGGSYALYHRASEPAGVILKNGTGGLVSMTDEYLFSRFGFAADWSPQGDYVAFAGRNGQCPYGLIVARNDLSIVFTPPTTPRVCDPSYSPDGRWLAFAGIQTQVGVDDGRLDLFIGQPNGYGSRNYTSQFKGDIQLLGWVGSS
ncbi:MAG TPA: hypothetical protein VHP83_03015 [Aggregatilineaceae bacterium]|nr:hypothetical protein [Aggregatilineaceae bacterium]